jgi:glycosyltransferase involved in cell wall biosynthesis
VRAPSHYALRWRPIIGLWNPGVVRALRAELNRFQPDVVHAELIHTHVSYRALFEARRSGARVIFSAHDAMTFCYQKMNCFHGGASAGGRGTDLMARVGKCWSCQGWRYLPGRNRAIRRALQHAHVVTAVSRALSDRMHAHQLPCDAVIPNAQLAAPPAPDERRLDEARARWRIKDERVVLFAGRIQEQKGIVAVLKSLARISQQRSKVLLLVAGHQAEWVAHAAPLAAELGLNDRVRVTGWLSTSELEEAYALSRLLCVPSTCFETFGLVHLEAMARGLPPIGTIYGGVPETIGDGGITVNPFDDAALDQALIRLLEDDALHARCAAAAKQRAEREFGSAKILTRWMECYRG